MKCQMEGCDGALEVTHSYDVGTGKTQRLVCDKCGCCHTAIMFVRVVEERGDGAYAAAQRLRLEAKQGSPERKKSL